MRKEVVRDLLLGYVNKFPKEKSRLKELNTYLNITNEKDMCDWDNMNGHLTASAFIYNKSNNRFLVLYHNDLKYYYCSGGHCEMEHESPLETVYNEISEETGLKKVSHIGDAIPVDIDIHNIPYNVRVNIPSHQHFDFRYLFIVDGQIDIKLDESELSDYKWVNIDELSLYSNYGRTIKKLKDILNIE